MRLGISVSVKPSPLTGNAERFTGCDSPVRVDWLTRRSALEINRQSAGILSPSWRKMTSPGTSSSARMRFSSPSRMTRQVCGRIFLSASVAFSARYSWKKLKTPLMILTAQTAMPNCGICAKKAPMPATQSIIAMRCVKLARNLTMRGVPLASLSKFGPNMAKRCWASSWVNPSGRDCKPA